jgi:putative Holliday junction resolvase
MGVGVQENGMRFFGVDYGTKRVGLAVGEDNGFGAYPVQTLTRSRSLNHDLGEIARLALKQEADMIVVGLPVNADGSHGPSAQAATEFAKALAKHTKLSIVMHDEFLTTWEAEQDLLEADVSRAKRKQVIDQVAAVKLLETFLRARDEAKQKAKQDEGGMVNDSPKAGMA